MFLSYKVSFPHNRHHLLSSDLLCDFIDDIKAPYRPDDPLSDAFCINIGQLNVKINTGLTALFRGAKAFGM